jgi:hypothetical protein
MTRRVTSGALPALIVAGGLVVAAALAALVVTKGDLVENDGQATTYLLSGRADIPAGQVQDDVVVARGAVTVDGTVEDDVIIGSGRVWITGIVHGDVTVLRGSARVAAGAEIDGDLRTSRPARVSEDAVVRGEIGETTVLDAGRELPRTLWFALWLAAGLTVLVAGLLLPRPAAEAARAGAGRPSRAVVLGGTLLALAPLAAGVLALSLLGLGLSVVVLGALALAGALGSAAAAVALGRLVGLPDGPVSFLAGWAGLGLGLAVLILASPLLGALGTLAILAFGIGALIPARERFERDPSAGGSPDDGIDEADEVLAEGFAPVVPAVADDEPQILASFPIGAGSRN